MSGFEIDPALAGRAGALLAGLAGGPTLDIRVMDYLEADWGERFEGILCNPPYLRFQDYAGRGARLKALEDRLGVRLGGLTNLHCLFLLKAVHQLAEGGRAAFVMPWEFLNAGYGERVKAHLLDLGVLKHTVILESSRGIFAGAVTTACILLLAKEDPCGEVAFHRAGPGEDLDVLYHVRMSGEAAAGVPGPSPAHAARVYPAEALDPRAKWRGYWKETSPAGYPGALTLGRFATVVRGIATGANDFFLVDEAAREHHGLPRECLLPCVAKARDAEGPVFSTGDFEALKSKGRRVWLLDAEGSDHPAVRAYLDGGRTAGVDTRFLTRHRSPWFALERRLPAPLWVSVFHRGGLRPVLNRAGVRNLTAFHCLYPRPGAEAWVEALFLWLLTPEGRALAREHGRECGAGLEKVEPRDLAGVPVPDFSRLRPDELEALSGRVDSIIAGASDFQDLRSLFDRCL